jgi:hypothetical protein
VALIAAGAGFAGGYLGSRWQAESELAQWRRDQLLRFCADLLAAGAEATEAATDIHMGSEVIYPKEMMRRFQHASGCVRLLTDELEEPALAYVESLNEVLDTAPPEEGKDAEFGAAVPNAHNCALLFQVAARGVLLAMPKQPTFVERIRSAWAGLRPRPKEDG